MLLPRFPLPRALLLLAVLTIVAGVPGGNPCLNAMLRT